MVSRVVGNKARVAPARFRYLFLVALVLAASFLLLAINHTSDILFLNTETLGPSWDTHFYDIDNTDITFTIRTDGCTIPGLQPVDATIKKFVSRPKQKPCLENTTLLSSNETHIWINKDNLHYHNISDINDLSCCLKYFYRPDSVKNIKSSTVDDRVEYSKECIDVSEGIEVMDEFVRIVCSYMNSVVYEEFFMFAIEKEFVSNSDSPLELSQNKSAYNVIVMGIDAVSRLNFHRTMPKTLAYLKKKGAIELLGYNKVGDNTFPNVMPMLLGVRETDLKKLCWPDSKRTFDNCPFVWESFKDAGFYTALGEDSARLGTFNYNKHGFIGNPTDYYLYTFLHESEEVVGRNKDFNSFLCMGDKYYYRVLLDYIVSLTSVLASSKLFGFFWEVSMSHDYLNYPMVMDESYESFIKKLESSNYLDDTILILLSDHGIRWGDIRYTKQGRLEERLPFVYLLMPSSFRENYSLAFENLKINGRRLTTPFDIHATLTDLTDLDSITNENIETRMRKSYTDDKSISLFMPIPGNRTCQMAAIDDHWCTCHTGKKHPVDSEEAKDAAKNLLRHLNLLLKPHRECAQLSLTGVKEVTELTVGIPDKNEDGWLEYMVVVETAPGGAVFEATMRHSVRGTKKSHWSLAGTVSRLNLYGEQSHCVNDYRLKLYCYCNT